MPIFIFVSFISVVASVFYAFILSPSVMAYATDYNKDDDKKLYVGNVPSYVEHIEFEEEVLKWGDVINVYYQGKGSGWGTVCFRTIELKEAFLKNKSR